MPACRGVADDDLPMRTALAVPMRTALAVANVGVVCWNPGQPACSSLRGRTRLPRIALTLADTRNENPMRKKLRSGKINVCCLNAEHPAVA